MARRVRVVGFTLFELIVTLAIATILMGIAVPGFVSIMRSNRAEVQVSTLVSSLNFARSEAVKVRGSVVVAPDVAGTEWEGGWRVWWDRNEDGTFNGSDVVLRTYPAFSGETTLSSDEATVTFNRTGAAAATVGFEYRVGTGHCRLERDVAVSILGRVTTTRRDCS